VQRTDRPKVAIFGDLYVRDNDVMNQGLVRRIEEAGGEAVTTPYSDYVKIIAGPHFERMWKRRELVNFAKLRLVVAAVQQLERRYHREVEHYVGPPVDWRRGDIEDELKPFGMVIEQEGESHENALKIMHLINRYPDIALFVQTSPAFCCPALVTEALSSAIEKIAGVPIVTVTYDGTEGDKNAVVVPYIKFPRTVKTA
jgi:predicted nucleotide-binding protein (sugar kinase/HSP70/actin superfamily)